MHTGSRLSFFSLLCLSWPPSHVGSLLIGQFGRDNTGTQHSCLLCCITHCLPVRLMSLFLVNQNIVDNKFHCQQREQCFQFLFLFFLMLLKAVVRAGTSLHIQKVSLTCHFWSSACWVGVACHRALVSPQWLTTLSRKLPTDRCWLTNQQLSTTNLCCGPSRLTAFCVTVIELNR